MRKVWGLIFVVAVVGMAQPVLVQLGPKSLALDFPNPLWPEWVGTVYLEGQEVQARGIPLAPILAALGGLAEDQALFVFSKEAELLTTLGKADLSTAVLLFAKADGERLADAPILFASGAERGRAVKWLVRNWAGEKLPEVGNWPVKATLTISTPGGERTFTLAELETSFVALTYPGSYTRSSGETVTATWTGIPLQDLLGNWPDDTEVEVVAADGYRMRYRYGSLSDAAGMWILAFKQDGKYLPFNPGYFRVVKAGPDNPSFQSSASARVVTRIEVHGEYRPYTLKLFGSREQEFTRWELEAAVACPCHARTVTSTHKGETHVYVGLPIWRLLAYVDDEIVPPGAGIKYDDGAFNRELAQGGYLVEIRAADGFSQVIPSTYLAENDGFILALKVDGRFLREDEGGPLLFVWDDGAPVSAGLKRVKWVTEIIIRPKE